MPRVYHVKKARKNHRRYGVKKGQPYWWWRFRVRSGSRRRGTATLRSVKCVSLSPPRRSQLTRSPFQKALLQCEEAAQDAKGTRDGLADALRQVAEDVGALVEDCQDKYNAMPPALQSSPTGELIQTRAERCGEIKEALEAAADRIESEEFETDEAAFALINEVEWDVE